MTSLDYPMLYTRPPHPALSPFVKQLWVSNEPARQAMGREHVVPTGDMHLVFRLSAQPLRLFKGVEDSSGTGLSHALVGGPRAGFYCKETGASNYSVGVQLFPGAAELLFNVRAEELAGRHTNLEDLWGHKAQLAREQLLSVAQPEQQLRRLEVLLRARLPAVCNLHPAVAYALRELKLAHPINKIVAETGYSHRYFSALFTRATGLTPKIYCRVQRLQKVFKLLAQPSLAEIALAAGYSDQAHFQREFREFTGVTPHHYRKAAPEFSHHIQVNFIQDSTDTST